MGEAGSDVVVQAPAPAVRVLGVSRVAPARHYAGRLKLSFFDTPWVGLPPVQQVFLYHLDNEKLDGAVDEFPAIVSRLKGALAETLAHYLPLAGKLEYMADTGDLVVDWSGSDAGVAFVEAEAEGMDVLRLAGDEAHDVAAFLNLVPELETGVLPAPLLSVQVTRLGAGLAIGMSMHHGVVDGRGAWRFIEAWSSASRVGSPVTEALGPPHYGREVVSHPRGGDELARVLLNIVALNLPVVGKGVRDLSHRFRLARRTFYLSADDILSLKQRIDNLASSLASADAPKPKPVSTFVALTALGWMAFVRSKGLGAKEDTYLMFHADLRARLNPPVSDAYLGNCVRPCVARCADAAEFDGEAGILHAARAVQAAVAEMVAAPLKDTDESGFDTVRQLPFSRVANVAASPRYRAYEATDFGFGMPARVEMVSMNHDGEMMLVGGRRDGEVQVSVSVDPVHMDALKACILGQPMQSK